MLYLYFNFYLQLFDWRIKIIRSRFIGLPMVEAPCTRYHGFPNSYFYFLLLMFLNIMVLTEINIYVNNNSMDVHPIKYQVPICLLDLNSNEFILSRFWWRNSEGWWVMDTRWRCRWDLSYPSSDVLESCLGNHFLPKGKCPLVDLLLQLHSPFNRKVMLRIPRNSILD